MRTLRLDFLHPHPGTPWLGWLLLCLGLLLAGWSAWYDSKLNAALAHESAEQKRISMARKPSQAFGMSASSGRTGLSATGEQLTLPWDRLFARLEEVKSKDVALLSIEADGRKTEATLTAEARRFDDMLAYVEALKNTAGFSSATIASHALQDENPYQPYRFVVRLEWKS